MPITYYSSSEEEAMANCAAANGEFLGACSRQPGYFTWRTHSGLCVSTFSKDCGDNLWKAFAVVYVPEKDAFENICIKGPGVFADVTIDAPVNLLAQYDEYRSSQVEMNARRLRSQRIADEANARALKGKRVVVIAGNSIPVGTYGRCIWIGKGKIGPKVGFKTPAGAVYFTAAKNVRLIKARDAKQLSIPLTAAA
jgi:hypothetical protein